MKVVLLDNIRGIGKVGDIKDVSDGYGRNFLLKRGLAKHATEGAVKEADAMKAKRLESSELEKAQAKEVADRIQGTTIEIPAKANKQGKLFAGVEAGAVAQALSEKAGIRIGPDQVKMDGHLKTTGEHPVTVTLTEGVTADLTISVVAAK